MIYLLFVENLKVFLFVCLFLPFAFVFDSEVSGFPCSRITLYPQENPEHINSGWEFTGKMVSYSVSGDKASKGCT